MSGGGEGGGGGGDGPRLSWGFPTIPVVCVLTVLSIDRRIFFMPQIHSLRTAKNKNRKNEIEKNASLFEWFFFSFLFKKKNEILTSVEGHGSDGQACESQDRSDFRAHREVDDVERVIVNFIRSLVAVAVRREDGFLVRRGHFIW